MFAAKGNPVAFISDIGQRESRLKQHCLEVKEVVEKDGRNGG